MKKLLVSVLVLAVLVGIGLAAYTVLSKKTIIPVDSALVKPVPVPISVVTYRCDEKKDIIVSFFDKKELKVVAPGSKPQPTGWVELMFPDNSTTTLTQTVSADGGRYANTDESFVFWSKGSGALILENDNEKNYTHCLMVNKDVGGTSEVYHDGRSGFTVRYPADFSIDSAYAYSLDAKQTIPGVKFTVPSSFATTTNLSEDSYVSIETNNDVSECSADAFLNTQTGSSTTLEDSGFSYSVASSLDAGAGNRYEETVFALPGTSPCIALRYFVHYGAIENYATGTVTEFDRQALLVKFDAIRRSLVVGQMFLSSAGNNTIFTDFKNGTYRLGDALITLENGISEIPQVDSEAKITTKYFGNEVTSDVNGDGTPDVTFIVTQNSGGSGTFYYAVVALATESGFTGTNALLLGDRIAPQNIEVKDGIIHVNFADRAPGEPMSATASVGVTKNITVKDGILVEQR